MLIPVKYHKKNYPPHIHPIIEEVAGHFDVSSIKISGDFSLHTEYSYGKRKFTSETIQEFDEIISANKNGIPMLWYSRKWAIQFAKFIEKICKGYQPILIEIHPPFSDYTDSIREFIKIYREFEKSILTLWPGTKILIENRSGTMYRGGKFIISKGKHLRTLYKEIDNYHLNLKVALDIPQLLTSYGGPQQLNPDSIKNILNRQLVIRERIKGIHLWGKKRNSEGRLIAHYGDLTSYFDGDSEKKTIFLEWMKELLDDSIDRYFVPEVNSKQEDLFSIINDLERIGIKFQT